MKNYEPLFLAYNITVSTCIILKDILGQGLSINLVSVE